MAKRENDVIVFGASGFTGKYVVETIAKALELKEISKISWGVAGRSLAKLEEVLNEASKATGYNITDVPRYQADVTDYESLKTVASKCRVILNCVGPYRFYGEEVVRACIDSNCNYVDVSGEPEFLESMQLKYHEQAENNGIYIVGACGFDSIPTDCGVTLLQQLFSSGGGEMNSVESFIEMDSDGRKTRIHHGTWQSAIHGVANAKKLRPLRKELYKNERPIPPPAYKLKNRGILHENKELGGYFLPFPGSDASVVRRSQKYFYYKEKIRPAQMGAYVKIGSWFSSVLMLVYSVAFGVLAQFKFGQKFLDKFAHIVTFGYVTHEGPSREEMDCVKFKITLIGKGWDSKLSDADDNHTEPPNKTKTLTVTGTNPGYGATCVMLFHAGLTILDESEKMPSKGGVYPPGAAFAKTTLIHRLNQNGVKFTDTS